MTELPPALAPWTRELSILQRDLALGLGELVQHLARELGPLRLLLAPERGEPDGYDGLSRRGNFERLLPQEWAMAMELPEEFLRRAAGHELGFFNLALRAASGSRRCIALFDAGPSQLGAPRIAQLAALIALANRASSAGAKFSWGLLQRDELHAALSVTSLRAFMSGRCDEESSAAMLAQWLERVGTPSRADDLWLIGAGSLARLPGAARASILAVREPDRGGRRLSVEVHRPGASMDREPWSSAVTLELPAEQLCERLIKRPWAEARSHEKLRRPRPGLRDGLDDLKEPLGTNVDPVFDPTGRRLFARTASGKLAMVPIVNPAKTEVHARVVPLRQGGTVTGLAFAPGLIGMVTQERSGCWMQELDLQKHRNLARRSVSLWGTSPIAWPPRLSQAFGDLLWHSTGTLTEVLDSQKAPHLQAQKVTACAKTRLGVAWVGAGSTSDGSGAQLEGPALFLWQRGKPLAHRKLDAGGTALEAFYGFVEPASSAFGFVAVHTRPGEWTTFGIDDDLGLDGQRLHPPPGATVCGVVVGRQHSTLRPQLLLLGDNRLWAHGDGSTQAIPTDMLRGTIVRACASAYGSQVAAISSEGELLLYSLGRKHVIACFDPTELG